MACDQAIKLLERMTQQGLTNVQNAVPHVTGPGLPQGSWNNLAQSRRTYDEWTIEAGTELLEVFADRSVAGRLRGHRYDAIMHRQFSADRHANLIHTELQELRTHFMELANELRRIQERFSRHRVRTVLLDTNDLLHYMRFDKIPWQRIYGAGTSVMIPHVLIDEIDKKSYDTHDTGVRKRARAGETVIDVLRDEPGHVRLPNNDEIVARACYLQQAIAPAPVTVVTGDNGMRARAQS